MPLIQMQRRAWAEVVRSPHDVISRRRAESQQKGGVWTVASHQLIGRVGNGRLDGAGADCECGARAAILTPCGSRTWKGELRHKPPWQESWEVVSETEGGEKSGGGDSMG